MTIPKNVRAICAAVAIMAICFATIPAITVAAQNGALVYFPQGGASLEVASGGAINVASGGTVAVSATSGLTIGGVANTGVVKSGTVTLDGSNPTPVTTGLTTVLTGVATLKSTSAPGDDPVCFTTGYSGGTLNIYAWKNTGGTDPTLVASTDNAATVDWIAVGN